MSESGMPEDITAGKNCFVIMPYGERPAGSGGEMVNFDRVYDNLIVRAVEQTDLKCVRCDRIAESGSILAQMFEHIFESEVAIVDITSLNPNVFYELGIRHALTECVTVLIKRAGTVIPFNIQGHKIFEYTDDDVNGGSKARDEIAAVIRNGLTNGKTDSPVQEKLNLRIQSAPRLLKRTQEFAWELIEAPSKRLCLITGDLMNVKSVDIWVSSENTNMEMARYFDRSISGVIRYSGAVKNEVGHVIDDVIAKELRERAGDPANVPAGWIVVTGSGELKRTNNVQKIFHAAAVTGQVGRGYYPINNIDQCVEIALNKANDSQFDELNLKSILFPLMGTGTARGDVRQKASELIGAAISWLEAHPDSRIDRVCFLTWSEQDLEVCQRVLMQARGLSSILTLQAQAPVTDLSRRR